MAKPKPSAIAKPQAVVPQAEQLLGDLRQMIEDARLRMAETANSVLTILHWNVGRRIRQDVLKEARAEYGQEILPTLSAEMMPRYGRGFSAKSLARMIQFAGAFPDEQIVATLSRQLSWSHFVELIPLKHPLQREYYAEICRIERWSVRTLRERIDSMLYERTALSRKPDSLIEQELRALREAERVTPDLLLRDPYLLDFLGLHDSYIESDLEAAIVREMEAFLLELGAGFTFVARQKRIQLDGDDFYPNLLFYNRKLKRLVAAVLLCGRQHNKSRGCFQCLVMALCTSSDDCYPVARAALRSQLGVNGGQPFKDRDVAESLVGADELVDGKCLGKAQGNSQVNRVKSPQLTAHPVLADEVVGEQIVGIDDPYGPHHALLDVGQELAPKPGECGTQKTPVRTLPANPETISTVASLEMMHSTPNTAKSLWTSGVPLSA